MCLIPESAHGTNAASAQMAGLEVEYIPTDKDGGVSLEEFKKKAEQRQNDLAAVMITYPSTSGVFEETIREVCDLVHHLGGQVSSCSRGIE